MGCSLAQISIGAWIGASGDWLRELKKLRGLNVAWLMTDGKMTAPILLIINKSYLQNFTT